jgi:putative addiction module CopG family antidote
MTVTLPPRLEALVRQKVEAGPYRSVDEVSEEALRLLDARDRQTHSERTAEGEDKADDLSLSDQPFTTSEEMKHAGFPFNVSEDFPSEQGKEIEAIMARGAPERVRALRYQTDQ